MKFVTYERPHGVDLYYVDLEENEYRLGGFTCDIEADIWIKDHFMVEK